MATTRRNEAPEPLDEGVLTIFVDGSMRNSPRRGGIGIRFVWIDENGDESTPWDHAPPAIEGANIQQMELEAPYQALRLALGRRAPFVLSEFRRIEIRTDSEYVKEGVGRAINYWSKNDWRTREGTTVRNIDDWQNLLRIMRRLDGEHRLRVEFQWKKGKKGKHAKAVDKLAKQSSKGSAFGKSRPSVVRRKKTEQKTSPGSVRMVGQELAIRIIEARFLGPGRPTLYRYEVVDEGSPFLGNVDQAESTISLARGHTYRVLMSQNSSHPQIVDLIEELEEDLGPYLDALEAIGRPATGREVLIYLRGGSDHELSADATRRRLERLVEEGKVRRQRASTTGRPYMYERRPEIS
jgi:ribonuclease HI